VTNGSLLTKELTEKILTSSNKTDKLIHINFSLDSNSSKSFKEIKKVDLFEKTVNNIKYFIKRREELGLLFPKISISFIVLKENFHEVKSFVSFWQSQFPSKIESAPEGVPWGVKDVLIFKQGFTLLKKDNEEQAELYNKVISSYKKEDSSSPQANSFCPAPFRFPIITAWGDVYPCCMASQGDIVLGNIKKTPFPEIWNGPKYKALRKAHIKGNLKAFPTCEICPTQHYLPAISDDERIFWEKTLK